VDAGENLQIAYRWAGGAGGRAQTYASELVALNPDVLLGVGTGNLVALSQQTRTIPIVFMQVTNPERDGFVASLARPGGNITGISNPNVSIVGERIKVLKEIAPRVTRILALFEPEYPTVPTSLRTMEATAAGLGMTVTPAGVRSVAQVEQAIEEFARAPNGGLAVIQSSLFATARERITALALRHGLPGMFHLRSFVTSGGLASYGIDLMAMYAQVPSYLDRVLKGGNPAEMPVQEPDKSEFIINLKTARLLGLDISQSVIGRTSAVIE
jgi:putative tryptophan/tyrosine transport system substrate-binding protein